MSERWAPVKGFEGLYEVSDLGSVRSVSRVVEFISQGKTVKRRVRSKVLSQSFKGNGGRARAYRSITLWCGEKCMSREVHSIVATAFLGLRPEGLHVCHKDGDGLNNRLDNLYYGTPSQNAEDALRHGTKPVGEKASHAKLNEGQVRAILAERWSSTRVALSKKYGVSLHTIHEIVSGLSWRHVYAEIEQ